MQLNAHNVIILYIKNVKKSFENTEKFVCSKCNSENFPFFDTDNSVLLEKTVSILIFHAGVLVVEILQ